MAEWLFIGPTLLAGIGQITHNYSILIQNSEYVELDQVPKKEKYKYGFAFVLPIKEFMNKIEKNTSRCERVIYMTVCETVPVNPAYGLLEKYKTVYCPSEFARSTLEAQFPQVTWKLLHHWAPEKPHKSPATTTPYTFYTIGNALDPRKNINMLLEAFAECRFGTEARLVIKATCKQDVTLKKPGVIVLNGLFDDEGMDTVHNSCHCYINCSHSEGVGMGAVEAALRSKPVIITDFGGLGEYVKTPWVVSGPVGKIGFDDFLFTKDLAWGFPTKGNLRACLLDCFRKRVTHWEHPHTKALVNSVSTEFQRWMREGDSG